MTTITTTIIVIMSASVVFAPASVFGHAVPIDVHVIGENGEITLSEVWGLENEEEEKEEEQVEVFSEKWLWMNFMLILSFLIAGMMSCFVCYVHKQEFKQILIKIKDRST